MDQQEAAAAQAQKAAEMADVQDYLEMMTARDQTYLDSLEVQTPEAEPEAETEDMPDNA